METINIASCLKEGEEKKKKEKLDLTPITIEVYANPGPKAKESREEPEEQHL